MKDSLNIAEWRKVMIRTALKRFDTKKEAAKALGVSVKTLERY